MLVLVVSFKPVEKLKLQPDKETEVLLAHMAWPVLRPIGALMEPASGH